MSSPTPAQFPPRPLCAIAAMAANRVIGCGNKLPWRLPEDFAFFKQTTIGNVLVMGRRTFESVGRPLPGRTTVVLSRSHGAAGAVLPPPRVEGASGTAVHWVSDWAQVWEIEPAKKLFLAGGAQLYADALPWCSSLFLTHVHASPQGDAFFPRYEDLFDVGEILVEHPLFTIRLHHRLGASGACPPPPPGTTL